MKIIKFFEQVKQEATRVVWSDKKELLLSLIVVILTVCAVSTLCLFVDYIIHAIVHFLINIDI